MSANRVPCPLSSRCPDSGWHVPGSATLADHQRRAGSAGGTNRTIEIPSLSSRRVTPTVSKRLSQLGEDEEIYGDEMGYDNGLTVSVLPVKDDEERSAVATVVSYEDSLTRDLVEEAIESGMVFVTNDDPDDDPEEAQFWLTQEGENAAANVIAEEYVRIGGDPDMADKIYVETNYNPDYAHISAGIDFPKEAEDKELRESVDKYLTPLYAAVTNVTDKMSYGSRHLYSAISGQQYQKRRPL